MNYIELINQFWIANIEHSFSGNETKLYFYLLHTSNSLGWKNPFKQSLRQLSLGSGISVNSVKSARNKIKLSGLIDFRNGKSGRATIENKSEYTLLRVSKIDTHADTHTDTHADTHMNTHTDTHADTVNKQNKTKLNNTPISPKFSFKNEVLSLVGNEQLVNDWMEVRKKKKASNTETAFKALVREINKSGSSAVKCIQLAVERDWKGFKAEWMHNQQNNNSGGLSVGQKHYQEEYQRELDW